jgi:hypothetical protein
MALSQIARDRDDPGFEPSMLALPLLGRGGAFARLRAVAFGELPADVRDCEVTVAALFRASLALNVLLGGEADMTFSARAHLERTRRRGALARAGWHTVAAAIDLACAVTRGECEHCATAWENHLGRDARVPPRWG